MKTKLVLLLSKQSYLCVTADVWSSRAQSYLGMTVHFINDNFERESFVLALRQMNGRQTNEVLTLEIVKVFKEYGICVDKVTHIVTDGGSAFCKAFKVYGKSVDHLVDNVNAPNMLEGEEDVSPFIQHEDGEYFYSNIIQINEENEMAWQNDTMIDANNEILQEEEIDDDFFFRENDNSDNVQHELESVLLPAQRRCFSHILNLIPNDFERKLSSINARAKMALVSVFGKLQTIWVFPRRSSYANTIAKEVLQCKLKLPCETRWNSKFDAIKHVQQLKHKINLYVEKLKQNIASASHLPKLTNDDWSVIAAYLKTMEPIATSLDKLQGEKNVSQGYILPTIQTMRHKVDEIDGGMCTKSFKDAMIAVIDSRFGKVLKINENNKVLTVAAVCVPRFKTDFIDNEIDVEMARKMLITECMKHSSQLNEAENALGDLQCDDDFFLSFSSRRNIRRGSVELTIEGEVDRFLSEDKKDVQILKNYPHVRKVYMEHNTTLASSGAVERIFSQCSLIFTPRRNRISDVHFEYALLLKFNQKKLDQ